MVETFVDYALGPHGRLISEYYKEHQLWLNTAVVCIALYKIIFTKKRNRKSLKPTAASE